MQIAMDWFDMSASNLFSDRNPSTFENSILGLLFNINALTLVSRVKP